MSLQASVAATLSSNYRASVTDIVSSPNCRTSMVFVAAKIPNSQSNCSQDPRTSWASVAATVCSSYCKQDHLGLCGCNSF